MAEVLEKAEAAETGSMVQRQRHVRQEANQERSYWVFGARVQDGSWDESGDQGIGPGRGKIIISFANGDEFERIRGVLEFERSQGRKSPRCLNVGRGNVRQFAISRWLKTDCRTVDWC